MNFSLCFYHYHAMLCSDCHHENEIKPRDPIRCRECGYRIMYKKRTKRRILCLSQHLTLFFFKLELFIWFRPCNKSSISKNVITRNKNNPSLAIEPTFLLEFQWNCRQRAACTHGVSHFCDVLHFSIKNIWGSRISQ